MSRQLRVLYPGAVYHVTARGNGRQLIFRDAPDCVRFLDNLAVGVDRYGIICHAVVLMGNHYHGLFETPRANLPTFMRHLNGCYCSSFNRRWETVGHLLQGRYNARLVEKQAYLLELIRYLYLNAFRANPPLCSSPEEYAWSSYRATLGLVRRPRWLTIDWVLAQFGGDYDSARTRLKAFVDEGLTAEPPPAVGGLYVASEDFVRDRTRELSPIPEIPRPHWQPLRPELAEIFATAEQPIATAYRGYGYTLREIAAHLGCHYATVSRHLRMSEGRV